MNSAINSSRKCFVAIVTIVFLALSLHISVLLIQQASAQTTHEVKISDFAFVPQNLTISPGDTIVWNNTDPVIHTLWLTHTVNGSTYLLSDPITPGATWNYTFNDFVELQYYSFEHLWVTGFINIASGVHDVAIIDIKTSKTGCLPIETVGQGYLAGVNTTVENQGTFAETFNVTAYAESLQIGELEVTLNPGENVTLIFTWNTTDFAYGNYTISATADTVSGESDVGDNTAIDGEMLVTIPGDINGDTYVNAKDAVRLGSVFGTSSLDPNYNSNADINGDGWCNAKDAVILGTHFSQHWE